jgi:hypothetical protein
LKPAIESKQLSPQKTTNLVMRNPKETLICHIWGQEEKKEENSGLCHALS